MTWYKIILFGFLHDYLYTRVLKHPPNIQNHVNELFGILKSFVSYYVQYYCKYLLLNRTWHDTKSFSLNFYIIICIHVYQNTHRTFRIMWMSYLVSWNRALRQGGSTVENMCYPPFHVHTPVGLSVPEIIETILNRKLRLHIYIFKTSKYVLYFVSHGPEKS